ncbi:MAG: hypothetical protein GF392_05795 [Candidatus Omnitrophica bacterium]|nr:hypothetical protein [Candidatus Omnitrophota bacterium]
MKALHGEMRDKGAMIGIDAMVNQRATDRVAYQEFFDEFIAENMMHFVVLGEEGMVTGPRKDLRKELFDFYSGFYDGKKISVGRDASLGFSENKKMAPGNRLAGRKEPITRLITTDHRRFISAVNAVAYPGGETAERAATEGLRTLLSRPKAPVIRSGDVKRFLEVVNDPERFKRSVDMLRTRAYGHMDSSMKLERRRLKEAGERYFSSEGVIQELLRKRDKMRAYADKSLSDEEMKGIVRQLVRRKGLDSETYNFGKLFFSQIERARQLAFSMSKEAIEAELERFDEDVSGRRTIPDMALPYRLEMALAIKDLMATRNGPGWRNGAVMFTADEIRFIVSITRVFKALEGGEDRDAAFTGGAEMLLSGETPVISPAVVKEYLELREKDIKAFRSIRQELANSMLTYVMREQRMERDRMERSLRRRMEHSSLLDKRSVLGFLASGVPENTVAAYGQVDENVVEKAKDGLAAEKTKDFDAAARVYSEAYAAIKRFEKVHADDLTAELNSHTAQRKKWVLSRWNKVRRRGGRSSRTPSLKYPGGPAPEIAGEALMELIGAARSGGERITMSDDPRLAGAVIRANSLIRDADLTDHPEAGVRLENAGMIHNVEILKADLGEMAEAVSLVEADGTLVILLHSEKNVFEDYMSDPGALAQMLRHEHLEASGVLEHRQIKALEFRENGNDPLTELNLMALRHMSEEQLKALKPEHELDPRGKYYAAARVELSSRNARAVLEMVKPDIPAAVLVPLTDDQMLIERSVRRRVSNETRRVIDSRFGPNVRVYYYTRGDSDSLRRATWKALSQKEFSEDSRARLVAFVTPGIDEGTVVDMLGQEAVAGVVREEIDGEQRTDEVMHVVLALGLIDFSRDRVPELEARIKNLMSLMVEDPSAVSGMDLEKLLRAGVSIKIKKVDLQEIEDWQASQNAVLTAL